MPPEVEELDLSRSAFRVGEWVVQPSLNRLVRGETTIQLELEVMDVLVCLAGAGGRGGEPAAQELSAVMRSSTAFASSDLTSSQSTSIRRFSGGSSSASSK